MSFLTCFLPWPGGQNLSYADATLTMSLLFICLFGLAMGQARFGAKFWFSALGLPFFSLPPSSVSAPVARRREISENARRRATGAVFLHVMFLRELSLQSLRHGRFPEAPRPPPAGDSFGAPYP